MLRPPGVINTVLPDRGKLVTFIAGRSKRRRRRRRRSVHDKKPQRCAEDNIFTSFTEAQA